jgi:hypothetical protein
MSLKRPVIALAAAGVLALAFQPFAQGATPSTTYRLQGTYAQNPGQCDVVACPFYEYDGTGTCESRCENASQMGVFAMELRGEQGGFPPSPCVAKFVSGTLSFAPIDPIFPSFVASVSGHNVDYKGYRVRGQITAGALSGRSVSAFVTYPGNVSPALSGCQPGTFTGTLEYPPAPV